MSKRFLTAAARNATWWRWCVVVLGVASLLHACVEAHEVPGTRAGLELDAAVPDAGEQLGDGDGDGDGDPPDASPPPPPPCNPAACEGASSLFGDTPGCCTTSGRCGLDFSALGFGECIERDAPGAIDGACPATSIFGFVNLPGCCRPTGMCGRYVQDFLPLGCMSAEVMVPLFPALPATSCNTGPQ